MKWNFYTIPNQLTLLRVIILPILWVLAFMQQNIAFLGLFVIAGLTDVLDGFIARRLRITSAFGAWFDSLADHLLSLSAVFWFWLFFPEFFSKNIFLIIIIFAYFLFDQVLGYIKHHQMVDYHLWSSKSAFVSLFAFFIHALIFGPHQSFFYVALAIIAVALTEEIFCSFLIKKMDPNTISLLTLINK
ncbi:MAG: CDP-alcohol phosphatidyltransferase family protein [Candidatus Woesearchaeota archaeon]|jgi:CDP-diacylglycerol--glycerol-3-phosphate 3-phosphatidyltransferase|nr:CDP-alcohol phosphatidyltransferase family protein [Candidatus Woesearchaeota archaeon]MDP7324351.1 CDP-alcohol phosphatidyltransferase family protein [Candidatus Woesearchaeota archaeon]MDP7457421.1 CDP-alcohol phosphatidyltransferase family protein [Candidatus Woesearchaeota archaeon]